jgi:hypothetical protein
MYANIQDTFLFVEQDKQVSYEDVDAGHGRVETRKCTVTGDLSHITRVDDWEKIQTLVRVESQRYIKATDITQSEIRYYISSLTPDPNQLEKVIRSH